MMMNNTDLRLIWRPIPLLTIALSVTSASLLYLFFRSKLREENVVKSTKPFNSNVDETPVNSIGTPHPYVHSNLYNNCIYLDYNATTPVYPEVSAKIIPFLTNCFGNPSSSHVFSEIAKSSLTAARISVGNLINSAKPETEIFFTSCGTESDNRAIDIAIKHFYNSHSDNINLLPEIITCAIEHPAVICYLRVLKIQGKINLKIIEVDSSGLVNVDLIRSSLTRQTALVTIMHSNNEVGTIQPLREIADAIKSFNKATNVHILLHSDAAQSVGKVCVDVQSSEIDLLTIVGHKYGAPKGVAALFVREGVRWDPIADSTLPMLIGGGQERGARGGTENVALIAGLGEASRLAAQEHPKLLVHLLTLKHRLLTKLHQKLKDKSHLIRLNGPKRACNISNLGEDLQLLRAVSAGNAMLSHGGRSSARKAADISAGLLEQLPNTISISFKGAKSYDLIALLSKKVACSAGSACHSVPIPDGNEIGKDAGLEKVDVVSDVLKAMQVPLEFALGTLRLSFGRHSTVQEIESAADIIADTVLAYWKDKSIQ